MARPKKEGELRTLPLSMRVTETEKGMVSDLMSWDEGRASATDIIMRLVREEHKRVKRLKSKR